MLEKIVNYLDIPEENRPDVLRALSSTSFYAREGMEALKMQMDAAQRDQLPQYRFVFRDDTLIGYSFLYGESGNPHKIGGSGVSNVDELSLPLAVRILEEDIATWEAHGCHQLAKVTRMLLENQKKGIGRRPEQDCR